MNERELIVEIENAASKIRLKEPTSSAQGRLRTLANAHSTWSRTDLSWAEFAVNVISDLGRDRERRGLESEQRIVDRLLGPASRLAQKGASEPHWFDDDEEEEEGGDDTVTRPGFTLDKNMALVGGGRHLVYKYPTASKTFTVGVFIDPRRDTRLVVASVEDQWLKKGDDTKKEYRTVDAALDACEAFIRKEIGLYPKSDGEELARENSKLADESMPSGFTAIKIRSPRTDRPTFEYDYKGRRVVAAKAISYVTADRGYEVAVDGRYYEYQTGCRWKDEYLSGALNRAKESIDREEAPRSCSFLPQGFRLITSSKDDTYRHFDYEYDHPDRSLPYSVLLRQAREDTDDRCGVSFFSKQRHSNLWTKVAWYDNHEEALEKTKWNIDEEIEQLGDIPRKEEVAITTTATTKEEDLNPETTNSDQLRDAKIKADATSEKNATAIRIAAAYQVLADEKAATRKTSQQQFGSALKLAGWVAPSFIASKIAWPIARPIWRFVTSKICTIIFGLLCYSLAYYFGPSLPSPKSIVMKPIEWGGSALEMVGDWNDSAGEATKTALDSSKIYITDAFDRVKLYDGIDMNDPDAVIAAASALKKAQEEQEGQRLITNEIKVALGMDEYWRGYMLHLDRIYNKYGSYAERHFADYWSLRANVVVPELTQRGYAGDDLIFNHTEDGKLWKATRTMDLRLFYNVQRLRKQVGLETAPLLNDLNGGNMEVSSVKTPKMSRHLTDDLMMSRSFKKAMEGVRRLYRGSLEHIEVDRHLQMVTISLSIAGDLTYSIDDFVRNFQWHADHMRPFEPEVIPVAVASVTQTF